MIDHFGLLAPLYDRVIGPPDPARLRDLLRLPDSGRLLDAGGGTGRVAAQLRPLVNGMIVSDISLPMLRQARHRRGLTTLQAHVERLPFPDGAFDRAVVVDALHHFPNAPAAMRELLRVLRPGGRLVIEEPDIARLGVKLVALAERLALMGSHFFSPAAIRDMALGHGAAAHIVSDGGFSAWVVIDRPAQ